jgi:phosphopantetheine--protein transferase-like protein
MDISTGIDIVKVSRVQEVIRKWNDKFLNRVFTDKELNYAKGKATFVQILAARFAAKEAVIKALGIRSLIFKDIEITNKRSGQPHVKIFRQDLDCRISVSISHIEDYAVASAVLVRGQ